MELEKESEKSSTMTGETHGEVSCPDPLHMTRYMRHRGSAGELAPEKKLMLAVLEDAVRSFQTHHTARTGQRKKEFDKAQHWIFRFGGDWVFSFDSICSALELDPQYIRSGLARWRKNAAARRPALFWTRRKAS
jgi:hypothetical protein